MRHRLAKQLNIWGTYTALLLTPDGQLIEPSNAKEHIIANTLALKEMDNAKLSESKKTSLQSINNA